MAPGSDTTSTPETNSPGGPEGSQAPSQAQFKRAFAPGDAISGPQSSVANGKGYNSNAPNANDTSRAGLSPAAASAPSPAKGGPQSSSSGSAGGNDERNGAASIESASAGDNPVTGGNTVAAGMLGPVLAPQQGLAPVQALAPGPQSSSSDGFLSRSGNNASASIEGLPADGSDSTPAPAVAPSAVLAPSSPLASSELAGVKNDLMSWWLWLSVAMATVATWLCCCCCMAAVLLLHRRFKRRIV